MDELLLRHLRNRTTEDENRSVEAWRRRAEDAEDVLADLHRLIRAGDSADRAIDAGDPPPAAQLIWRAEARRAQLATRRKAARPRLRHPASWITAAAAATVAFTLWNTSRPTDAARDAAAAREFRTAAGETAVVPLDDGSVIRLGPESRLTALPGRSPELSTRRVTLEGEAFFSIATDEVRPFVVTTAAGTARVLGTRFHLSAQPGELALVVVEGRVALASEDHGQGVQVGAGQATRLVRGSAEPVVDALAIEEVADWLGDFLVFQDTPLAVAMREVGRRYGREVEIADSVLMERTLTMWFDGKSLEDVMTVVCSVIDATCSIGVSTVRIEARDRGEVS
ncbi:MAG: FecR domain-containing protein [Gemmatimonadota bacterium]|nr:FecR domain-containing protein [Gemmatimonadota bacterium]